MLELRTINGDGHRLRIRLVEIRLTSRQDAERGDQLLFLFLPTPLARRSSPRGIKVSHHTPKSRLEKVIENGRQIAALVTSTCPAWLFENMKKEKL